MVIDQSISSLWSWDELDRRRNLLFDLVQDTSTNVISLRTEIETLASN